MPENKISQTPVFCSVDGKASPYLLHKDGYDYYRCSQCGLVFIYPQPSNDFLANEVYSEQTGYQKGKNKDLTQTAIDYRRRRLLNYLGDGTDKKILDVGCSNGEFLFLAKKQGFECFGVELNPLTAKIARDNGLNIFVGLLENTSFPENFFDFINLGDLIEHVGDPRSLLKICFALLKPQGQIIITTPNLDSFWAKSTYQLYRWFGVPWSTLTPPYHLFQFSTGNLRSLMEQVGLRTKVIGFNRPSSLKYELGMLHLWKKYKMSHRPYDLFFASFSFGAYMFLYTLNFLTSGIRSNDVGVVIVGSKD